MPDPSQARYAIYAVPEIGSALWSFGSSVLGYDAASMQPVDRPTSMEANNCNWEEWTAEPRKYGFHATLKAPFRLGAGACSTESSLLAKVESFAAQKPALILGNLAPRIYKSFVALMPEEQSGALTAFAADCTREFDTFRAPLTAGELARRHESGLSERQASLLAEWGYPYVFEEFRYHMTLTGKLEAGPLAQAHAMIAREYQPADQPAWLDNIALFRQPTPSSNFAIMDFWQLRKA